MTKPNLKRNVISTPTMINVDGKYINVQRVECSNDCGSSDLIRNNRFNGLLPEVMITKILHEHGWEVRGRKVICPTCQEKRRGSKPAIKVVAGTAYVPPPATVAITAKGELVSTTTIKNLGDLGEATKLDFSPDVRRVIFRTIDGAWDEKAKRYIGNNSDEYLATDLKVPRAWIEAVRREAFGEIGTNDDLEELKSALPDLEAAIQSYLDDANKLLAGTKNLVDRAVGLHDEMKTIRQRVARVEAAVLPRRR